MDIITWIKSMEYFSEDSENKLKRIKNMGVSAVLPHLKQPVSLGEFCDTAARHGVKVHPWIKPAFGVKNPICRTLSESDREAQKQQFGFELLRACLNNRSNLDQGIENLKSFIDNNQGKLAGIHLDYVRNDNALLLKDYPCQCDACQQSRLKWLGHGILTREDLNNPCIMYKELEFRNKNITDFVRQVREITDDAGLQLSMAARANYLNQVDIEDPPVYGLGPAVYEGQDWHAWAEAGYFDFICTMNYHTEQTVFEKVAMDHARLLNNTSVDFYSGIGIESSMGKVDPDLAGKFIIIAENNGAKGCSLFHWAAVTDEYKKSMIFPYGENFH